VSKTVSDLFIIKDFPMSKYIVNEIHTGKKLKPGKRIILYEDFFQNLGILAAMLLKQRLWLLPF